MQAFAHLRADPSRINYPVGQTSQILWNVAETGCGAGPVLVQNTATASLYTYTPYQPNAASPGRLPGHRGPVLVLREPELLPDVHRATSGPPAAADRPAPASAGRGAPPAGWPSAVTGPARRLLPDEPVRRAGRCAARRSPPGPRRSPRGSPRAWALLGLPYVWGGGGDGAGPNDGCVRGGGALNSCRGLSGLDCSGLTAYVLVQGGFGSPGGTLRDATQPGLRGATWEQATSRRHHRLPRACRDLPVMRARTRIARRGVDPAPITTPSCTGTGADR